MKSVVTVTPREAKKSSVMRTDTKIISQDKRVLMLLIAALVLINMGLAVVAFSSSFGTPSVTDGYGVRVSQASLSWAGAGFSSTMIN